MPDAPTAAAAPAAPSALRRMTGSSLFWPVVALVALLLVDSLAIPGFLTIRVQDGHLYGSLIDILRNGAPTAPGRPRHDAGHRHPRHRPVGRRGHGHRRRGRLHLDRGAPTIRPRARHRGRRDASRPWPLASCSELWNGFLVVGARHPADHRDARPDDGRPRHRDADHRRADHHRHECPCSPARRSASCSGCPCRWSWRRSVFVGVALVTRRTALGMLIESVGINPEASRLAGVRSRGIVWTVYVFVAPLRGHRRLMISSNITAADANNAGLWIELDAILAVVIGGTSLAGGRFTLTGTLVGALIIQTLTTTVYTAASRRVTLVFKAVVVIAVCLLQSPRCAPAAAAPHGPPDAPPSAGRPAARIAHGRVPTGRPAAGPDQVSPDDRHPSRHRGPGSSPAPRVAAGPRLLPALATFVLFVAIFGAGSLRYEASSPAQVLLNLFVDNAFLIVLAVGMTFVILTGGIDLSVGSVVALSGVHRGVAARRRLGSGAVVIAAGPAGRSRCSGCRWALVIHYFEVQPFIVTLAGMFLARGLCYVISVESDPDQRPALHRARAGRDPAARRLLHHADGRRRRSSSSRSPPTCCTPPGSAARSTPSAATSSRRCSWACRSPAPGRGLRHQRVLLRARRVCCSPSTRCRATASHARRHRARRDRRRRHRRHAALRRRRASCSARCSACSSSA